jgi:uncharacterized membrane protein
MVLAVLRQDNFLYQLIYLLHIGAVVSAFSGVMVSTRFQAAGRGDAATGRTVGAVLADLTTKMHVPALAASGLFGILLVVLSDEVYEFSQTWISLAFLVWFALLGVMWFLLRPAQRKAATGDADGAKKVSMFTGIVHLLFLVQLVVMIWKPGL